CVYSVRGKRDEPFVSCPVRWEELARAAKKRDPAGLFFSPDDALERVRRLGDLFALVLTLKQRLPEAFMKLSRRGITTTRGPEDAEESGGRASSRSARSGPRGTDGRGSLERYAEKRDFTRTAEPAPVVPRRSRQGSARRFVIQKHAASHLHYDFRLEMGDTLKSWAVPKGLPYELGVKRSAFQVEDHPIDYLDFEGTIPAGQYGGGTVMVWDIGTYEILGGNVYAGDLKLWLNGKKLKGEWHIFRIRSEEAKPVWLVAKSGKPMKPLSAREEDSSVLTRRSMARIAKDNDRTWQSNRSGAPRVPRARPRRKPAGRRGRRRRAAGRRR
ncbi:MAG TPA: DNA polymerase ligase N-terminal domain-containing protein, partial [Opitutaceae bacterium]|nr:DNA polymerase ligase N-terminal domain-containing protein [Opitutaceae bacterium]